MSLLKLTPKYRATIELCCVRGCCNSIQENVGKMTPDQFTELRIIQERMLKLQLDVAFGKNEHPREEERV